jgi:hypothetical protein
MRERGHHFSNAAYICAATSNAECNICSDCCSHLWVTLICPSQYRRSIGTSAT